MRLKYLTLGLLACALAAGAVSAQDIANTYGTPNGNGQGRMSATVMLCPSADGSVTAIACQIGTAPTQSAAVGGNVALTTSAQTVIPAANRKRWSYQAQGTGWACASWVTTTPTIAVSAGNVATCGGSGAFLLSGASNSSANSSDVATQTGPLTVIAAAPNAGTLAMNVVWEGQ